MGTYPDTEMKIAGPGIGGTEDELLGMIASLEERLSDVRELHRERQRLEEELDQLRVNLESREAELEERESLLNESSTEIHQERRELEEFRKRVRDEQESMIRRRQEMELKEREVSARLERLEATKAQLEAAELALKAERDRREVEAANVRREQEELTRREAELNAKALELGGKTPELQRLAEQLALAQEAAAQRAAEAERRQAEAQRHAKELERRCHDLTQECDVVRNELAGTRRQAEAAKSEIPNRVVELQRKAHLAQARRRSLALGLAWLCAAVAFGAGAIAMLGGSVPEALLMLGVCFGAYFTGTHAVVRRLFDPPTLVIGLIGATFGLWFPLWQNGVAQALLTWNVSLDGLPAGVADELPMAISVWTTGLTMAVGLFALTWSGRILIQVGFVSCLAGALALIPDTSGFGLGAAAVLWNAVTGTGLSRWAMKTFEHEGAPRNSDEGAIGPARAL